jgi:hypothetical protein
LCYRESVWPRPPEDSASASGECNSASPTAHYQQSALARGGWIDERDLLPLESQRDAGRPVSERSAWAIIAASLLFLDAFGDHSVDQASNWLDSLASSERIRARKRLRDLLIRNPGAVGGQDIAHVAAELRVLLGNRAIRLLLRASPRDLADLRGDDHLALAGLSRPESGIVAGDMVEGYVDAARLAAFVDYYLLDSVQREDDANVVLHVVSDDVARQAPELWRAAARLPLVLAADLEEHRRPREQARAAALLANLGSQVIDA